MATQSELEKYEVLETIGRGSFGTIRKVRRTADGHILCRKEIQYIKMSQKEREQLHAEFSILNSLKHENIVGYYHREHLKISQELYLYMEYCGGGDLSQEIQKLKAKNQYADEEYVWSIFAQLVSALYRCHYGVDAPEPGKNVFGPATITKPGGLKTKNQVMILHRDLKPENVFLGIDNSVKLGDFGLSKLMQSHDFASTYVGTPFYMSPEICAAERYTLHSDIWSLGCVIYELCAKTPPFNAKTHFNLIQKIKEGRVDPLPSVYSPELSNVIKSCLNVNPLRRPDTAALLNVPAVRLLRKQKEVVDLGRVLKLREEHMNKKTQEADVSIAKAQNDRSQIKAEMESSLRREWEVKAGLEITRRVQEEKDRLQRIFEAEIQLRVQTEVEKQLRNQTTTTDHSPVDESQAHVSSVSTNAETDFPSGTDLSTLSLVDSPAENESKTPPQRKRRGPLARARTQFDSPMDVAMADPSPMSIACLSLSPRRTEAASVTQGVGAKNIFSAAAIKHQRRLVSNTSPRSSTIAEDDEDAVPDLPSPTRPKAALQDPFKGPARPGLLRQKTLPMNRLGVQQPVIFQPSAAERPTRVPSPPSPKHTGFSPVRKAPPKPPITASNNENEMLKAVVQRNMMGQNSTTTTGGRTLVELAQARAGMPSQVPRYEKMESIDRKENRRGSGESAPVWDPEQDEMPSPFLIRGARGMRRS